MVYIAIVLSLLALAGLVLGTVFVLLAPVRPQRQEQDR